MTPAKRIQPYLVNTHRNSIGMPSLPLSEGSEAPEVIALLRECPECLAYAREEIARLKKPGFRTLAEHDHESKIRCRALERMVAAYEAAQEKI
jgi:hypothetical protein